MRIISFQKISIISPKDGSKVKGKKNFLRVWGVREIKLPEGHITLAKIKHKLMNIVVVAYKINTLRS